MAVKAGIEISENVVFRWNGDASVTILRLDDSENYFSLDGIAAQAWKHFDGKRTLDDVLTVLTAQTGHAEARLGPDLVKLVKQLGQKGLLQLPPDNSRKKRKTA